MQSTDPSRPAASVPASECPSPPVQRPALSIEACPTAGVLTSERALLLPLAHVLRKALATDIRGNQGFHPDEGLPDSVRLPLLTHR